MDTIFDAIEFAVRAHRGQYRKATKIPYIVHPLNVAKTLIEFGCSKEVVIAGLLHDTLEDTSVTFEQIEQKFGKKVSELVMAVSEPDRSDTWENRKSHTIDMLRSAPMDVLLIECADKLDNITAIKKDYEKLGEKLWERFNRPKEKQKWYYQNLKETFKEKLKCTEYEKLATEFASLVTLVFT